MVKQRSKTYAVSRFQHKHLLLGCTADSATLLAVQASTAVEVLAWVAVDALQHGSVTALCGALPDLKPENPVATPASLRVTVDDSLARSFVVTPPRGAQSLRELRASAAARFAALYGDPTEQWLLAADWQVTVPFIVCALPRQLFQALESLDRTNDWRLDSVKPALVRAWNCLHASIPANGWLVVGFGQTLTLVHTRNEQAAGLRTLRLPGAPDLSELATLIEQERLRMPVPAEAGDRQSLLWTGAADWLPAAPTIAGLASRVEHLRAPAVPTAELTEPCQIACHLAFAGRR
ncbi:hypothetical protein [Propionivibrio sp.]|uniref:hypothetical protein n=1 Tax=Propionivibrio sp. TaxID=2212460 RepID=UPI003BF1DFB9